jgi:hypothetical protein
MTEIQAGILNLLKGGDAPAVRTIREIASVLDLPERAVETALLQLAAVNCVRMRREDGKDAWHILETPAGADDSDRAVARRKPKV